MNSFNDDDVVKISSNENLIPSETKTIKEIKDNGYKFTKESSSDPTGNAAGYFLYADILDRRYQWKLFTVTTNNKKDFGIVVINLESAEFVGNTNNITFKIKFKEHTTLKDKAFNSDDIFRIPDSRYSSVRGAYNTGNKQVTFSDVNLNLNGKVTIRIDPHDNTKQKLEGAFSLFVPSEMEKLNCNVRSVTGEGNLVTVDLEPMKAFIPKVD